MLYARETRLNSHLCVRASEAHVLILCNCEYRTLDYLITFFVSYEIKCCCIKKKKLKKPFFYMYNYMKSLNISLTYPLLGKEGREKKKESSTHTFSPTDSKRKKSRSRSKSPSSKKRSRRSRSDSRSNSRSPSRSRSRSPLATSLTVFWLKIVSLVFLCFSKLVSLTVF